MKTLTLDDFDLFKGVAINMKLEDLPSISLKKDEHIITKDYLNSSLHLLIEGEAGIYIEKKEPLKILYAGEVMGEISLVDQQPTTASIICHTECKVIIIDEVLIWKLVNGNHRFTVNLLQVVVNRFRGLAIQVESSLEKQKLLEYHINIDDLTGLFNRGWLNKQFSPLLERYKKNQQSFSYLMIDIDHFKNVNDTYGHQAGDLVLQNTANIMNTSTRATDYAIRYGGEEMAILLPNADAKNAIKFAERLRKKIADNVIEYEPGKTLSITVSIGISSLKDNESVADLIKLADDALYYGKEHGRNQVKYNEG